MIGKTVVLTKLVKVTAENAMKVLEMVSEGFQLAVVEHRPKVAAPVPSANGKPIEGSAQPSEGRKKRRKKHHRRSPLSQDERLKVVEMRDSGVSYPVIAKRFGITDGGAWHVYRDTCQRLGVKAKIKKGASA